MDVSKDGRPPVPPAVSIVVCTRDRPDDCVRAVRSVLRDLASRRDVEVLVVDQSSGEETRRRVEALGSPLVRCVGMEGAGGPRVGASAGRNRGAALAQGDLLLFVDDDVEVLAGWFEGWRAVVDAHRECAVFFGEVLPCRPLPAGSFVAMFEVPEAKAWGAAILRQGFDRVGISANMGVRRSDFGRLRGLDAYLGPGSGFRASEDLDFAYRVVASGGLLLHAPGTSVLHHGVRTGSDAARLTSGYQLSIGAMLAKHARIGDVRAQGWLLRWGARLLAKVARGALRGRRPLGVRDVLGYLRGVLGSFRYGVDRTTALYRPRGGVEAGGGR